MTFVIDAGNTRLKWALARGLDLQARGEAVHRGAPDAALAALARALPAGGERVLIANVAGAALGARLAALVEQRTGAPPELVATSPERLGVRCGYDDCSRLGVDRWVAVIAAYRLAGGGACVVDAGTAVTFDAVDAAGQHRGGLILAGPRLVAAALERNTSGIGATMPAAAPPRGLDILGRSTDAAVGFGAMLAVSAAVDRACAAVESAIGRVPVYLTGGDALELVPWLETKVQVRADLVLEGLALLAAG
jgi:type III pantothenate kinase